jgi:hypothetical protein
MSEVRERRQQDGVVIKKQEGGAPWSSTVSSCMSGRTLTAAMLVQVAASFARLKHSALTCGGRHKRGPFRCMSEACFFGEADWLESLPTAQFLLTPF